MIKKITLIALFSVPLLSAQTRVINGSTVSEDNDMWRFIVALKVDGEQYCGGSVIKPNWVLTAAHCLSDENGNLYPVDTDDSVGVNAYNLNDMTEYSVKRYIIHPNYDSDTIDNDIALIELDTNITSVTPIPYDINHTIEADIQTMLAGWGNMDKREGHNNYPNDLQEALVPIIDYDTCNSASSYDGNLTENMICAGYLDGRRDGCQGDSGGPLIVDNTLVGIVSWGIGCAQTNYPGVYTKVQNYSAWITNTTKESIQKPIKPSPWVPIGMGDIIIFVPSKVY